MTESSLCWSVGDAAEALELLARAAKLRVRRTDSEQPRRGELLTTAAARLGLDAEAVNISYAEVRGLLRSAGPAAIRVGIDQLLMIVGRSRNRITVVQPDHRIVHVPLEKLVATVAAATELPVAVETERMVADLHVSPRRRGKVVEALLTDRLRSRRFDAGWMIRLPAGSSFRAQLKAAGAQRQAVWLLVTHAAQYALTLGAWWLLGRAAFLGHLDRGWLSAWALMLLTVIPLQLVAFWLQGRLALKVGALLKQRLLAGAFRLNPDEIRREGAGQLLGRVIEAEAVESLALGGGLMAGLAAIELVLALTVLGLASALMAVLLVLWMAATSALATVYFARRREWVRTRVSLTHDLIERMLGHRTRIAQQVRERWHDGEDASVEDYVQSSVVMDRAGARLLAVVPRGWMLVGLCGMTPLFVGGSSAARLGVAVGGTLLAFRALDRLTNGLWNLVGAAIAWKQTAAVFRAAGRESLSTTVVQPRTAQTSTDAGPLLEAMNLKFTHHGRSESVLDGCSLSMARGDRMILQGESGGGKSTFAALLAGLRTPESGLLLLDGLDRHTLGASGWRRRVVLVPQFHENHLTLGTVAFNVLMGGEWPPQAEGFVRAESVLRELGLGDTLDRMPSGILQTIGETGWQLSHGEQSRIYLARALLQNPDVLILDESFAQLDPETMQRALNTVAAHAPTVLLIAHP
jgi:ATP-binding cassette subfamily B protein